MILITGVTGHVGSVAAGDLLKQGASVRVLVRSADKGAAWLARGAEVIVGELGDVATLTGALRGVDGAFLLLPPPSGEAAASRESIRAYQRELGGKIAAAVAESRVPYVVLLSSIGAQHPDGTGPIAGLHDLEQSLLKVGVKHTFVRACSFMENHGGAVGAVSGMGVFPTFFPPDYPAYQVATADIGHVVAGALHHPPAASAVINLVGPREYSAIDVKDAFARAVGKPVNLAPIPLEQAAASMRQWGLPPGLADIFAEMYQGAATGRVAYEPGATLTRGKVGIDEVVAPLLQGGAAH